MNAAASGRNATALMADARNEQFRLLGLAIPAFVIVGFVVVIPTITLFWLSFFYKQEFTLQNYSRMWKNPSYMHIFYTTFSISLIVTGICILLGYLLAYLLAQMTGWVMLVAMSLILLPFWTSLLVRTYAWTILLRRNGLINEALISLGLTKEPLALVYNETGTIVGMVHIMLPFLALPLYAAMRSINPDYVRAASSLGASRTYVFWTVYFPLTMPGLVAGTLLVFIYCLGFYVTPALLGGGHVTFVGMKVFDDVQTYVDWGPASSLGLVLLVITLVFFYVINRVGSVMRWFGEK
jgi:putative spermidine/putrescine transport system permease protein/spermidine/putrescine transport system permease protein